MDRFWPFSKSTFGHYNIQKLIDTRILDKDHETKTCQIVCDIDKTYLETSFENHLQMIKIAFEDAKDKITVSGAAAFLTASRWGHPFSTDFASFQAPRPLHFVSASPPQLRATLEEKLVSDGLDWSSDSFKNQVYNLRKGRLNLLRHHVAYKTGTILSLMKKAPPKSSFLLIGDNAEFDSFIYLGIALYLEGHLNQSEYLEYLLAGGVADDVAKDLASIIAEKPDCKVMGIYIREAPGYQFISHASLTEPIFLFNNYFEALVNAVGQGLVDLGALPEMTRWFHNELSYPIALIEANLRALERYIENDSQSSIIQDLLEEITPWLPKKHSSHEIPINKPRAFNLSKISYQHGDLLRESRAWAQKIITQAQSTK